MESKMEIADDCKYYKGDIPCKFHKIDRRKCKCSDYVKGGKRILIIKLGAPGDIIRTTPIVRKLRVEFVNCEITWITETPPLLNGVVDFVLGFDFSNIVRLMADHFDVLYNFDKGKGACALANLIRADIKKGFKLLNGKCSPFDEGAVDKWLTGLDDDLNLGNKISYPEEIFKIAGLPYSKEKYLLPKVDIVKDIPCIKKPVIGLNTGCGLRWKTRLWSEKKWIDLSRQLIENNYSVILLGGKEEHEKNLRIAEKSKANYFGYFPLLKFVGIVDKCDLIVSQVTMTMHIAIGLGKKVVILNNIFNKNEFELYGLGKIVEPEIECLGCYKSECEKNCMDEIRIESVFNTTLNLLQNHS